jgi:hypothetical protein
MVFVNERNRRSPATAGPIPRTAASGRSPSNHGIATDIVLGGGLQHFWRPRKRPEPCASSLRRTASADRHGRRSARVAAARRCSAVLVHDARSMARAGDAEAGASRASMGVAAARAFDCSEPRRRRHAHPHGDDDGCGRHPTTAARSC